MEINDTIVAIGDEWNRAETNALRATRLAGVVFIVGCVARYFDFYDTFIFVFSGFVFTFALYEGMRSAILKAQLDQAFFIQRYVWQALQDIQEELRRREHSEL